MQSCLNLVNVCLSYNGMLNLLSEVSRLHQIPIQGWISSGQHFKFVGDNVDKQIKVRDLRSDHYGKLYHMYSILAIRNRVDNTQMACTGCTGDISKMSLEEFLPSNADVNAIRANLVILVARILVTHIPALGFLSRMVPMHILHRYSNEMATKSEVALVDVLMENKASHAGSYLGSNYKSECRVLSGGDQLTR